MVIGVVMVLLLVVVVVVEYVVVVAIVMYRVLLEFFMRVELRDDVVVWPFQLDNGWFEVGKG